MIIKHKTIELLGEPLFTWVTIKTPLWPSVPLPADACFAYIIDGDNQSLSKKGKIRAESGQIILS